jgi:K+-transporting ATPase KdpF subunit
MTLASAAGAALAIALLTYLLYALLHPEKF